MPNRIPSAETKAWICTAADCSSVRPNCTKPFVVRSCFVQLLLSKNYVIVMSCSLHKAHQ